MNKPRSFNIDDINAIISLGASIEFGWGSVDHELSLSEEGIRMWQDLYSVNHVKDNVYTYGWTKDVKIKILLRDE